MGDPGTVRASGSLATWTQALAIACVVVNLVTAALAVRAWVLFDDVVDNGALLLSFGSWSDAHDDVDIGLTVSLLLEIVTLACLIGFSYQLTRSTARHDLERRWSPQWSVGSWFVPFANVVLPFLVLREDERVAQAAANGRAAEWRDEHVSAIGLIWWILVLAGQLMLRIGVVWAGRADLLPDANAISRGYEWIAFGAILLAAGCGLLAVFVNRIAKLDRVPT